ncbi:TetR/AcrR family transcriptional regulator [Rhodococcus sp. BP-241]|uniref:TetR/AcrR family transcriptional regulator n=1 Tax=Rhodococcus sp. BP-241 TaxID=2739441 RepID=UPI001C9B76FB|nr:TetR/AcrR family transcriptional regulator [Rhodococcus sp. BP-241]MBY6706770.1 TetR/AcrR family transcriptional regulator [Rhodococcus sp. BP-241]
MQTAGNRLERRKARTRQALVDAAREMIADGRSSTASIADITAAADVGFGSFYNHFEDKPALFAAAVEQVLEQMGETLDGVSPRSDDPVQIFCDAVRRTGRAAVSHRQAAEIVDRSGFALLDAPGGLGPRARRDLAAAVDAGRLEIEDLSLATAMTAGVLFALVHRWLEDPGSVDDRRIDDAAERLLVMLGTDPDTARVVAHTDLEMPQIS